MEKDKVVTLALLPISLSPQRKQQESSFLREDVYSVGSHSGLRKTQEAMTAMVAVGDDKQKDQEVTPQLRVPFCNMDADEEGAALPNDAPSYAQQQVCGVWWSGPKRRNPRVRAPSNLPIIKARRPGAAPVVTITCGLTFMITSMTLKSRMMSPTLFHLVASGMTKKRSDWSSRFTRYPSRTVTQLTSLPSKAFLIL